MSTITPARRGRNADIADNDDQLTFPRPLVEAYLELWRFKNLLVGCEVIFELGEEGVAVVFSFYQR
jgi:hypothetical protein